jgi:hypothetical protein
LNGIGEVLELFDATIGGFNNPSNFRDASRLVCFFSWKLSFTIEEWWHCNIKT